MWRRGHKNKEYNIMKILLTLLLAFVVALSPAKVDAISYIKTDGGTKLVYLRNYYPSKWKSVPTRTIVDSFGMWNRQCTSYAAFKVKQMHGYHLMYWGDAKQWLSSAKKAKVKIGSVPKRFSVGISTKGKYGHAVFVEKISGDKKRIRVSEYNGSKVAGYSTAIRQSSSYRYIYF